MSHAKERDKALVRLSALEQKFKHCTWTAFIQELLPVAYTGRTLSPPGGKVNHG